MMSETAALFVATVIIGLMGWAISLLLKLNDKVTLIDQWREGHEGAHVVEMRINTERHNSNTNLLAEIRRELREMSVRKSWWKRDEEER